MICSFLPMYFEPDLYDVMAGVWECRQRGKRRLHTMVPHMINNTDMWFVEVFGKADLAASFAPQGKWKIVELLPQALVDAEKAHRSVIGVGCACSNTNDHNAPMNGETLRLRSLDIGTSVEAVEGEEKGYDMVMLCPVSALDVEGRRLGKGAGFYDRFISGVKDCVQGVRDGSSTQHCFMPISLELVGIALEEQVLPINVIPMEKFDQYLHTVITPSKTIMVKT